MPPSEISDSDRLYQRAPGMPKNTIEDPPQTHRAHGSLHLHHIHSAPQIIDYGEMVLYINILEVRAVQLAFLPLI